MINKRIEKLRELMKAQNINFYYIPTSDYHNSEYVGDHFQTRVYMSGFTGSAGVMLVTLSESYLWSDGRYYIQAEEQIKGSEIKFMRQADSGVASPYELITRQMNAGDTIGFDGRTVSMQMGKLFYDLCQQKQGNIVCNVDLVADVWEDRPILEKKQTYLLGEQFSGESTASKISKLRDVLEQRNIKNYLITSLDDIAYVLNIRGRDIPSTPVILSYLLIDKTNITFYADADKLPSVVAEYLADNAITVKGYDEIYSDIKHVKDSILLDPEIVNYSLFEGLQKDVEVIESENPTIMMKAIKNPTEIENLRIAHIKDGVAVTKFMYWLKKNITEIPMDEISVSDKLTSLRAEQEDYIETSFDTISAYNANAAMMHYHATEEGKAVLKPEGVLLVDSGGQYFNGTTDITRTFSLGPVDPIWKRDFTLVLTGMTNLSRAKFLAGCNGINLDILARQPLWNIGIDYRCGTGHGVGFVLGVHEGPHGFRWKKSNRKEDTPLAVGMVVTDEPGVYQEGSHGLRIENELIVQADENNEYGQFLSFETITFAPIDLDLIDKNYLDEATRIWLNAYHKEVFEKISPYLSQTEKDWLKEYTREI